MGSKPTLPAYPNTSSQPMYNPISTYRLQFHKDFTFQQLDTLLPYLQKLGVTTIYASPIFAAVPDSVHGYDGVDPNRINPEIGTESELRAINHQLQLADMGWLQDIVPNHMAYYFTNQWLMDILEKGPLSRFASFFDTSLSSSFFHGRILAPFLAEPIDETLKKGHLTLYYDQTRFLLDVSGNRLPLKPGSYATVLQAGAAEPSDAIRQLLIQLDQLRHLDEPEAYGIEWAEFRLQLAALMHTDLTDTYIEDCLNAVNQNPALLHRLADEQHYRFCTEVETRQEMTYRRFFTINGLICLNMDDETVFQQLHHLTKTFIDDGVFQGLRIDHIDGLFDPNRYLDRLRELAGDQTYIVVEKILQGNEVLPTDWPVQGTSGYDFLALVNNLLTNSQAEPAFRNFYHKLIGSNTPLPERIRDRKAYFLAQYMGGELNNLYHYFLDLNLADEAALAELTAGELKLAIGELLVECPVYRYYANQLPLPANESDSVRQMLKAIQETKPELESALALLEKALLTKPMESDADYNHRTLRFYQRLMQFSGPLMAKGVEDTLLYTYNCFIGHNEVGDSPERFGLSVEAFHETMQHRQAYWPLAQNATATHDTKRGEDVRARLNVLTDLADEWLAEVQHWQQLNAPLKQPGDDQKYVPDANDEYLIYQNLLGAYPMPSEANRVDDEDDFPNRFSLYLEKALQEAKRHTTGWVVDDSYHEGVKVFTDRLLERSGAFWPRFESFHRQIADFGIVNSLAQVLLKFTCPGVPDVYQGAEGWDLNLVDPDNRRPVDFDRQQMWLTDLLSLQESDPETLWATLWQHRFDGRVKLWLTYLLLHERQSNTTLFAEGEYVPLLVDGTYRDHILAFARRLGAQWYIVAIPLHFAQLCRQQKQDTQRIDWQDTSIHLPIDTPTKWVNCLDGTLSSTTDRMLVQATFTALPLGILRNTG
jgi:(1->4)-alpha-D-glucan 1-alpha-D-glucosylmutase